MKIHSQVIKKFILDIVKENNKKYVLKKDMPQFTNSEFVFSEVGHLMLEQCHYNESIVEVPVNWKELIELKYSIKKIKALVNSREEKARLKLRLNQDVKQK